MFTKRIIPCLDVNNGRVVKGVNFVNLRDAGDPVEIAAAYGKAGADELVFLDITASSDLSLIHIWQMSSGTSPSSQMSLVHALEHWRQWIFPQGATIRFPSKGVS